jgi:hypothetical protein
MTVADLIARLQALPIDPTQWSVTITNSDGDTISGDPLDGMIALEFEQGDTEAEFAEAVKMLEAGLKPRKYPEGMSTDEWLRSSKPNIERIEASVAQFKAGMAGARTYDPEIDDE